jgi:hypothetical protein
MLLQTSIESNEIKINIIKIYATLVPISNEAALVLN